MSDRNLAIAAAVGAAAVGAGAMALWQSYRESLRQPKHKRVYVLRIGLKIKEGGLETLKTLWAPLADHCRTKEPNTLSYEMIVNKDDPTDVMIYERYVTYEDLTTTHHSSEAFKAFGALTREKYPDLIQGRSRWEGYETNVGYM